MADDGWGLRLRWRVTDDGRAGEMGLGWWRWGPPRRGSVVGGYELLEIVGTGTSGTVWKARPTGDGPAGHVALKQSAVDEFGLRPVLRRDRAIREGTIATQLAGCPHVIAVRDVFEERGSVWLVGEYLDSVGLDALIALRGALDPGEVAWVGWQIADALAAAHEKGIVHRDVAPSNVLVARGGDVAKLADFGVARQFNDPQRTIAGGIVGSPAYLSPEEALGGRATPESDVYSLAAVLYHAVEGRPPFGADDDRGGLLDRIRGGVYPPPRNAGPLVEILESALHHAPNTRPSAEDLADDLHAFAAPPGAETRRHLREHRPPATGQPGRPRRRVLVATVAAAVLLAGAVAGARSLFADPAPAPSPASAADSLPGLPASVPVQAVTGDRRTLDPCRLIDPQGLAPFGQPVISPGETLAGCTAYFPTSANPASTVEVRFADPGNDELDGLSTRGAEIPLGGARIQRYEPLPPGLTCTNEIVLADGTPIVVDAYEATSGRHPCLLADATVAGVARSLADGDLRYDPNRLARIAIARFDPCFPSVPDGAVAAAVPGIQPSQRAGEVAGTRCLIGQFYQGQFAARISFRISPRSMTPPLGARSVQLGSRTASVYPWPSTIGSCTSLLQVRARSDLAPQSREYIMIYLYGPADNDTLCARAGELTKLVNATLPATL